MRHYALTVAAVAAGLFLAGCLVSKTPLLDAKNARERPVGAGAYMACQVDADAEEPDCQRTEISIAEDGLHRFFMPEEDETSYIRFGRLAPGALLAQAYEADDDSYYYFLAEREGEGLALTLIACSEIPRRVRAKYQKRGEMTVDEDATVCDATTLGAVKAAAKAYRAAAPKDRARVVYMPIVEGAE
ncbi:MAG: hypothetical protein AB7P23_12445 [Amphiplicatus sp.]